MEDPLLSCESKWAPPLPLPFPLPIICLDFLPFFLPDFFLLSLTFLPLLFLPEPFSSCGLLGDGLGFIKTVGGLVGTDDGTSDAETDGCMEMDGAADTEGSTLGDILMEGEAVMDGAAVGEGLLGALLGTELGISESGSSEGGMVIPGNGAPVGEPVTLRELGLIDGTPVGSGIDDVGASVVGSEVTGVLVGAPGCPILGATVGFT